MKIEVIGSKLNIIRSSIMASGSIGQYKIQFQFDPSWDKMTLKRATFYQPSVNRDNPDEVDIVNNEATVPSTSLTEDDYLYIGVYGINDDNSVRMVTDTTYIYINQGSPVSPIKLLNKEESVQLSDESSVENSQ